jgi:hypothetical protein
MKNCGRIEWRAICAAYPIDRARVEPVAPRRAVQDASLVHGAESATGDLLPAGADTALFVRRVIRRGVGVALAFGLV